MLSSTVIMPDGCGTVITVLERYVNASADGAVLCNFGLPVCG